MTGPALHLGLRRTTAARSAQCSTSHHHSEHTLARSLIGWQVLDVGRAIRDGEKALHVMVLCHTDQPDERKLDQDGLETGYALNYLSNVVLIEQLKPLLARWVTKRHVTCRECRSYCARCCTRDVFLWSAKVH